MSLPCTVLKKLGKQSNIYRFLPLLSERSLIVACRSETRGTSQTTKSKAALFLKETSENVLAARTISFWKKMGESQSMQVPGLSDTTGIKRPGKIVLSDEEWKAKLTPEQYSVCRKHGTERAWTGDLLDNKQKGTYTCACCNVDIFSSSTKFDSGSGWPSFFDTLKDKDKSDLPAVDIRVDTSHGMSRTEVLCGKCDAHLGHVFNDGPAPTGLRYCINSVCLKFRPDGAPGNRSDL